MKFQTRKQLIIQELEHKGVIDVKPLSELFSVSEITVRRDLDALAAEGLLLRTHGGAMKISLSQLPASFIQKAAVNANLKDEICLKAADLIQDNDVVFLDCGSTVFRMCPFIRNKHIQVITNSLPIVNELLNSAVKINLVGGEVDVERQAVHGQLAVEHIRRYRAAKAFIGVGGISLKNGLSASSENEAQTAVEFMENAQEKYILCDHTKLETDRYFPFFPVEKITHLITNTSVKESIKTSYLAAGISVV